MTAEREFDIVLFGATGFTGRITAEELLVRGAGLRWAIAGRDRAKLEAVKAELVAADARATDVAVLVADSHDREALDALARRARVVCTTVGPYAKYGNELVAACAAAGTHYGDLTGETPFMRRSIDANHELARKTGARIVHACGFDSIPSDLGVLLANEAMRARTGAPCDEATLAVVGMRGGVSGGTVASMLGLAEAARRDREVRKILLDPYALNPEGERTGPDGRDPMGVGRADGGFTAPFVMAGTNTRVVRRTNALLGYPYGRDFRYQELSRFRGTPSGLVRAVGTSLGFGLLAAAVTTPGLASLVGRVLPKPGEGPSKAERERGRFRIEVVGKRRGPTGAEERVVVKVGGDRDPGYGFTAIMLAESALCLARDPLESEGGVHTPASAMGMTLVKRLRAAGMTLEAA